MLLRHCIIWISALSCALATPDLRPGIYQNPDTTIQFQAITEGETGLIYVLDQYSRIYRLSGTSHGSQTAVNVSLPINRLSDPAAMRSQILLTTDRKGEILACNHIGCGLMDSENLSWTHVSHGAGSGNFSHMQPILANVHSNGRFYIASQDTGTSLEEAAPILSVRELNADNVSRAAAQFTIYRQNFGNRLEGKITINQSFRKQHPWKIKPVFISILPLEPNPFGYLITVQSSLRPDRSFESRLGRFCAEDKLLRSYSETSLECRGEGGIYTIAMSGSMIMHKDEAFLAVVFGKGTGASWETFKNTKKLPTTALCVFSVEGINRRFNETFDKCRTYSYKTTDDESKLMTKLPWIVGYDSDGNPKRCSANRAPMCQRSAHQNNHIDVYGVLNGQACVESRDIRGLQLLTVGVRSPAKSSGSERVLAATYIHKTELRLIHLNLSADRCQSDLLSDMPTEVTYRQHEFLPSLLTNGSRFYVVLSDNKVQRYPVGCGMHSTCAQCMEASKCMGCACGWCESGYCSTKDQCKNGWYDDRCSPVIEDFFPKNGSVKGGTIVTIRGQLFGSANAAVAVTVAGVPCPILSRDDTEVTCKTLRSDSQGPVVINVTSVQDRNRAFKFDIIGDHHLESPIFSYLTPEIDNISVVSGPKTVYTLLTMSGTNLHIGNKQEVLSAGIPCSIVFVNDSTIRCIAGQLESVQQGHTVLLIDGTRTDYTDIMSRPPRSEHRDDLVIEKSNVILRMTLSGYNTFIFDVSSPDSLAVKQILTIRGTTITGRDFQLSGTCFPETRHLKCPAIYSLKPYTNNVTNIADITATLSGNEFTGSLKIFSVDVYPDPYINTWDEIKSVAFTERIHGGQYVLRLSGGELRKVLTILDYRIDADEHPCTLTRLEDEEIECRIQHDNITDDTVSATIQIAMGNADAKRLGAIRFAYLSKKWGSVEFSITAACAFFAVTIIAVTIKFVYQWRKKLNHSSKPFAPSNDHELKQLMDPQSHQLQTDLASFSLTTQQHLQDFWPAELLISSLFIDCGVRIGSGSFGTVYEGRLRTCENEPGSEDKRVAIKVITAISSSKAITQEAYIMKDLRHRHIMKLYGVVVGSPFGIGLVMEFMSNGDLHTHVKTNYLSYERVLDFSVQIAEGMAYLSNQKIVHRDLAARNCMLDDDLNIRIADFGLSRDLYQDTMYIPRSDTQLPYRWIALECFTGPYSTNSDVWSFGVAMWELFENGSHPYGEMDPGTLFGWLSKGFRLAQPENCSDDVYGLMCQCWNATPSERPDFQSLSVHLRALVNKPQLSSPLCSLSPADALSQDDVFFNCMYDAESSFNESS